MQSDTLITTYKKAINFLQALPRSSGNIFKGEAGFKRAKNFFSLLGNPQNKLKVIHIAGTSGKGSTAMILSHILRQHNFKVGLSLSPHVYDIRERCQINNSLLPAKKFYGYLNNIMPALKKMASQKNSPSYFEVLLGLALTAFVTEAVDYAILETGIGGLLDATNTVDRDDKLCLLTKIGYDHTQILGEKLTDIASQKAGIIRPQNYVIALRQNPKVETIFATKADNEGATIEWVETADIEPFLEGKKLAELNYQLVGDHQKQNAALACIAASQLSQADNWQFYNLKLTTALKKIYLPGRFERISIADKTFILDGAHNQQKINALLTTTKEQYPKKPYGIILSLRESKNLPILKAREVLVTRFSSDLQDMPFQPLKPKELTEGLKAVNPRLKVSSINNIRKAIEIAFKSTINLWVITGSFFMLKEAKDALTKL